MTEPTTPLTADVLAKLRDAVAAMTPEPWTLCTHLQSAEADAACPCGYRGGIYGSDDAHMVCEMGSTVTTGQEGMEPPRFPRDKELANARGIVLLRNNASALIAAAMEATEAAVCRDELRYAITDETNSCLTHEEVFAVAADCRQFAKDLASESAKLRAEVERADRAAQQSEEHLTQRIAVLEAELAEAQMFLRERTDNRDWHAKRSDEFERQLAAKEKQP